MAEPVPADRGVDDCPSSTAGDYYTRRREACDAQAAVRSRQDRRLSQIRAIVGVAALATGFVAWQLQAGAWGYGVVIGLMAALLIAASYQEHVRLAGSELRQQSQINRQCLARLSRHWDDLPVPAATIPAQHTATARDLDLFGRASLFQFLCRCETRTGVELLRDWLLEPATPEEVRLRQEAVRELAPRAELHERLALIGRQLSDCHSGPERMVEWSQTPNWLTPHKWLYGLVCLVPCALLLSVLARSIWGTGDTIWLLMLCLLGCQFLLSLLFAGKVHEIFRHVSSRHGEVRKYQQLFRMIQEQPANSPKLVALRHAAAIEQGGVILRLQQLGRIMLLANLRHSAICFPFWLVLQVGLLWDFHILARLEAWKRHHGPQVRTWFSALGEYEALVSLAALHHDYPDWSFPSPSAPGQSLTGTALGHPLLPDSMRVVNDIQIEGPGTCLLVTGSNMSGKSTLLRSIGINLALAQMGGPVCAARLQSPPLRVMTSMRITDSLDEGVSFYLAELRRLKEIVDFAHSGEGPANPQILFLLDEILQGTNSRERHIAVQRVLAHLIDQGTMGAVSTHDLELAQIEPLRSACRCVHFRETLERTNGELHMHFDYRLRDGVSTTSNALQLLEIVGLTSRP
ncbi:MAG: DNA mismatch repair protein [Planctomycetaceae bacterium]|nr:DNA mismatch repair protein [Planctomycetaceae bacterium]